MPDPSNPCPAHTPNAAARAGSFIETAERDARSGSNGNTGIATLLDAIEAAASLNDLQHGLTPEIQNFFEADHIVYHWVGSTGQQFGWGTYPAKWVSRYLEQDYIRIDPVILACHSCFHPVDWKRLDWSPVAARKLLADALAHGIGTQGYSVPIRGPHGQFALFTVNRSCNDETWAAFTAARTRELILLAHSFNTKALELQPDRIPRAIGHLGKRELDVLTLLAKGYGRSEAAAALQISDSTLRTYLETARSKLSAANATQAVAIAVSRGLIIV